MAQGDVFAARQENSLLDCPCRTAASRGSGVSVFTLMVLRPGQSPSDTVTDEHPRSEQWLFVISGAGSAVVGDQTIFLKEGSLLLIEQDEPHRITCMGKKPLVTINFYSPPAHTSGGNVRRAAKQA